MALNPAKLEKDILATFKTGLETEPDSSVSVDGAVKCKHTESDIAGLLADNIVNYAAGAQIMATPGPFLFPNPVPPHTPPVLPDLQVYLLPFDCLITTAGKLALKNSISDSFAMKDPSMSLISAGVAAYISTLTLWQSPQKNTTTGVCFPGVPPVFKPSPKGRSMEACAKMMAEAIHGTFTSSVYQGVAFTILLGTGPIVGSPLF